MRFSTFSLAAVACLVASAHAAPVVDSATAPVTGLAGDVVPGNLLHNKPKPTPEIISICGAKFASTKAVTDVPTELLNNITVSDKHNKAKGIIQGLVESLYPGLSKTSHELDLIVSDILKILGANRLADDVLKDQFTLLNALTKALGIDVACLVKIVREVVEKVVGAAKAEALKGH